tara:strand:+ start:4797 stop:5183 length:387 start_codon:yes stop_codon:yes gene_type:complete
MASELRVNTLKDAAGNNSIATSFVASGSAKAWGLFNGTGTIAIRDSFNVSGITDLATGKMTVTIASDMGSANYTTALRSDLDDSAGASRTYNSEVYTRAAGSFNFVTYSNSAEEDHAYDEVAVQGDLA